MTTPDRTRADGGTGNQPDTTHHARLITNWDYGKAKADTTGKRCCGNSDFTTLTTRNETVRMRHCLGTYAQPLVAVDFLADESAKQQNYALPSQYDFR